MLQAKDLLVGNLPVIDSQAPAQEAIRALLAAEDHVVAVFESTRFKSLITDVSVARMLERDLSLERKTAIDLALDPCPVVEPTILITEILALLAANQAIAVISKDKLAGALSGPAVMRKMLFVAEKLERELDAVIGFSSDEILVADQQGRVLRANRHFEENFGIRLEAVLGRTVDELEERKIFYPSVTKLVLEKKEAQTVIQSRRDGRKLLATGTPVFNEDGSIFRVVVNTRDITRLNLLKQQLEEAELLKNRYQQELVDLRQGYLVSGELVAESPAMIELIKVVQKIAAVDSTVLLTGESGVGKGMIARYIHNCSPRAGKPFTVVNCGAIPENLLESELFGYAGGAFTGALREGKIGKLELANDGTLFLDEITDLPLNLQVKLLHVIQEGIISRIGGAREIKLNLRFIAATNRDIVGLVEEGKFREDLYFRLDVIPLLVPPLRERLEDIRILAEQFLARLNRRYQRRKSFSGKALQCLEAYSWPGNVRELENLIERMMIVVEADEIGPERLPRHLLMGGNSERPGTVAADQLLVNGAAGLLPLRAALDGLEKKILEEALRSCRTTYAIADALQVDQSTVVRKLKKHKLTTG